MKASEAKQLAEEGGKLDEQRLNEIYQIIEMKAGIGCHKTAMNDFSGAKAIIKQLKADDYKCTFVIDTRDGNYWEIEW